MISLLIFDFYHVLLWLKLVSCTEFDAAFHWIITIWLLAENEMPGEEAHVFVFFFFPWDPKCNIKEKRVHRIWIMIRHGWLLLAAKYAFPLLSAPISLWTGWESTACSGQDVCSEIVVQLQLCLLEQETSLNSITIYPVH